MAGMDVLRAQCVHLEIVLGDAVHGGGLGRSGQACCRQAGEEGEKNGCAEFHQGSVTQDWVVTGWQVCTGVQVVTGEQVVTGVQTFPQDCVQPSNGAGSIVAEPEYAQYGFSVLRHENV
ncbi:hypothetical protein [Acidithiobacillus ferridurans]|uniref:hypothetical protein n=1 Tax=Acidithiobacillus ferridurans TaxID=1232575 RepID=UPI001F2CFEAD|nr:hypothetical protein [Acidithiobacillus ferridurans]